MIMATMDLMAGKESEVGWSLGCNKFMGGFGSKIALCQQVCLDSGSATTN